MSTKIRDSGMHELTWRERIMNRVVLPAVRDLPAGYVSRSCVSYDVVDAMWEQSPNYINIYKQDWAAFASSVDLCLGMAITEWRLWWLSTPFSPNLLRKTMSSQKELRGMMSSARQLKNVNVVGEAAAEDEVVGGGSNSEESGGSSTWSGDFDDSDRDPPRYMWQSQTTNRALCRYIFLHPEGVLRISTYDELVRRPYHLLIFGVELHVGLTLVPPDGAYLIDVKRAVCNFDLRSADVVVYKPFLMRSHGYLTSSLLCKKMAGNCSYVQTYNPQVHLFKTSSADFILRCPPTSAIDGIDFKRLKSFCQRARHRRLVALPSYFVSIRKSAL
ncbi:hypothetical protein FQR65_LT09505 [Abscondita terminalis]|nr:hypothetical protein FQR65_LT09505 [Abscondita terminalis]